MGQFLAQSQSQGEKKETISEVCLGKKELEAEKARVDFLDKIHDLNTPML